jgi:hypothetical protein
MTKADLILGLTAITGWLTVLFQYRTNRRESAKFRSEAVREEEEAEPFFKWLGGGGMPAPATNSFIVHRGFRNEGGAVRDLAIKVDAGVQASITRKDHIGEHDSGKVEFAVIGANRLPDLTFEIFYTTRRGKRSKQSFLWPENGEPQRVSGYRAKREP